MLVKYIDESAARKTRTFLIKIRAYTGRVHTGHEVLGFTRQKTDNFAF